VTSSKVSFNETAGDFEALISDDAQSFPVTLLDFKEEESEQAGILASKICNWLSSNLHLVKAFAASQLTELKNSTWLEEGESPVSEQSFIETIELDAVNAYSEGGLSIFFKDKGLFWGHSIVVNVDTNFSLIDVEIAG
jgi:hypothetical protein